MKKLDKKAFWLFFVGAVSSSIIPVVLLGFYAVIETRSVRPLLAVSELLPWVGGVVAFIVFCSFVWAVLHYRYYRYSLGEQGFQKEYGIIWKKYVTIPYSRIQNVDIYRGLLARILGLSDLNIQTAGAGVPSGSAAGFGAEGRLPGLSRADAERVRDELLSRAGSKGQGL